MIVKGSAGGKSGHAGALAKHLMRTDENSRVEILELDPAAPAGDLDAALREFQMLAKENSRGERGLYQASINPQADDRPLTPEEWKQAADILEKKLGFDSQPRAIVLHEKDGREHIHVIWQRFDAESGKLRDYKHNYKAHVEAAREIEQALDLHRFKDIVQDRSHDFPETQQSLRSGMSVAERKQLITGLYHQSDSSNAFVAALEQAGFDLARGDKPNTFVIIDQHDEVHSLVRQVDGVKKAEVHAKLLPREPEHFRSVAEIGAERHHEQPARDPRPEDRARAEIRSEFAQERLALEARHAQERENLARSFESENRAIAEQRGQKLIAQEMKRKSQFGRPIKKQPLRAQNVHWWRADQQRVASQQITHDRLVKKQAIELEKLGREEKAALRAHDRQHRQDDRPRHAMTQDDRLLAEARTALEKIRLDDRSPNSPVAHHARAIKELESQRRADEKRLTTFLYHQEQSRQLFRDGFENADAAYQAFRDHARKHGLKNAQNELLRRAEQFGEVRAPIASAEIERAAQSLRSIHYTEKKMFEVRLRVDAEIKVEKAMREHGVAGPAWQHNPAEENLSRQINAHRRAMDKAKAEPDDRRLVLMAEAKTAAGRLDNDTYGRLNPRDRRAAEAIVEKLAQERQQQRLKELRQQTRHTPEIERRDWHTRDGPYHQ